MLKSNASKPVNLDMVKNVFLIFKNLQNYFHNVWENIERNQIKTTRKFTATALPYFCIRDGGLGLESFRERLFMKIDLKHLNGC